MRRVCTLKGLAVYLNEDPNSLIKEYQASNQIETISSNKNLTDGNFSSHTFIRL